jgi:ABC-2 type transport system permease protein
MKWTIARKEFKEHWRDGRLRGAMAIILVLLTGSLITGFVQYRDARSEREAATVADRREWLGQGDRNPHTAAHFGRYAFKPATRVAMIDPGVNPYLGIAVWLEAHYQDPFRYRPVEDDSWLRQFGNLTAASVLQVLFPLLIVLFTFSSFAGEREIGTLKQLLSLGVSPKDLAAGKALGLSASFGAALVPATTVGVAALLVTADDGPPNAVLTRGIALGLGYLVYFAVFFGVGIGLSALVRSSSMALLLLLGFWTVSSFIMPRAAADIAEHIAPTPSSVDFWAGIHKDTSEGIDGHNPSSQRAESIRKGLLAQYKVSRTEDLPINFDGWMLMAGEEYGNGVFDKHYGQLWDTFQRQDRVQGLFALASPLLAVRSLSMAMAGTDFEHHKDFAVHAEQYRRTINRILNGDLTYRSRTGQTSYTADANLWRTIPEFSYQSPSTWWALSRQLAGLGMLLGWAALAAAGAWFAVWRLRAI